MTNCYFFLDIIQINIAYNISDNSKPNANKQLLNQFVEHSRKNKETNLLKTGKNDDILEVESGISSEPTPFHWNSPNSSNTTPN